MDIRSFAAQAQSYLGSRVAAFKSLNIAWFSIHTSQGSKDQKINPDSYQPMTDSSTDTRLNSLNTDEFRKILRNLDPRTIIDLKALSQFMRNEINQLSPEDIQHINTKSSIFKLTKNPIDTQVKLKAVNPYEQTQEPIVESQHISNILYKIAINENASGEILDELEKFFTSTLIKNYILERSENFQRINNDKIIWILFGISTHKNTTSSTLNALAHKLMNLKSQIWPLNDKVNILDITYKNILILIQFVCDNNILNIIKNPNTTSDTLNNLAILEINLKLFLPNNLQLNAEVHESYHAQKQALVLNAIKENPNTSVETKKYINRNRTQSMTHFMNLSNKY